jgi:hypothetical protein
MDRLKKGFYQLWNILFTHSTTTAYPRLSLPLEIILTTVVTRKPVAIRWLSWAMRFSYVIRTKRFHLTPIIFALEDGPVQNVLAEAGVMVVRVISVLSIISKLPRVRSNVGSSFIL